MRNALHHPHLEQLQEDLCTYEILQDRKNLEEDYGCVIRGMAYPYGSTSDAVVEILKKCGIVYARTTVSTESFAIPTDWLRLPATCHHSNPRLMELTEDFKRNVFSKEPGLFYLWGHSYEFDYELPDNNWTVIEKFAASIGNRDDIWYATNIELYDYIAAFDRLVFSVGGLKVFNPTCKTVFFKTDKGAYSVAPGETIDLGMQ